MGNISGAHQVGSPRALITVPHAQCVPGNPNHTCDSSAVMLAACLSASLLPDVASDVITGNINRVKCDLNRSSCQGDMKRQMVDAINSKKYTLLIDAHSYPHREQTDNSIFAARSKAHDGNTWDADLFFIVNDNDKKSKLFFARVMDRVRSEHQSYDLRLCAGNNKPDLIHKGYQAGLLSALVEVGEHLTSDQVAQLATSISRSIALYVGIDHA